MFHRIKPMITTRDLQIYPRVQNLELRNPLCQENMVWKVIPTASLTIAHTASHSKKKGAGYNDQRGNF